MSICRKCKINEHSKNQKMCKKCRSDYDRLRYKNKKEILREQHKRYRINFAKWYQSLKDNKPCTDCGKTYPYYVMHWDHLGNKNTEVSKLLKIQSKTLILEEIAKCELVCGNCHAERSFQRRSTR
jgi:hypothetical protein